MIIADGTERALEIIGEILESGSGGDACFGHTYLGIVLPTAYVTYILFHVFEVLIN